MSPRSEDVFHSVRFCREDIQKQSLEETIRFSKKVIDDTELEPFQLTKQ